MSLLTLLSNASASLGAHRADSATASNNLQNANTPGYARQRAELGAVLPAEVVAGAYLGRGVALLGVTQARDRFVEAQLPAAAGQAAFSAAQARVLGGVSALNAEAGLGSAVSSFFSAWQALAQNPSDPSLRQATVGASSQLAIAFHRAGSALGAARTGIDAELQAQLSVVNAGAAEVARLNGQVRAARAAGAVPNDLLDARQRAVDSLAELTGAIPVPDADGNISLALAGGITLVNAQNAAQLTLTPDPANGGHLSFSRVSVDGAVQALPKLGGTLGGLVSARDGALAQAERGVDALAFELASALNTVHAAGFGKDGGTGRPLFTLSGTAQGAAMSLAVDPAVLANAELLAAAGMPGAGGDGTNANALLALASAALPSGSAPTSALAAITASFGTAAREAQSFAAQDASLKDHLLGLRESVSGVSIDEELVNLTRSQRAYEAVLKVIQAGDEMLKTLLSLK